MQQIPRRTFFSILALVFCSINLKAFGFEKLDSKYTPSFGDKDATTHMTEYFSFSCEKCLRFINRDFMQIKEELIGVDQGYV